MQQLRLFFAMAKNKRNCCILLDLFHYYAVNKYTRIYLISFPTELSLKMVK